MKSIIKTITIAILVFTVEPARAAWSVPYQLVMYNGPGLHFGQKATIAARETFEIGVCNPVWCHIQTKNRAGWIQTGKIIKNPDQPASIPRTTGSHGRSSSHSLTLRLVITPPSK